MLPEFEKSADSYPDGAWQLEETFATLPRWLLCHPRLSKNAKMLLAYLGAVRHSPTRTEMAGFLASSTPTVDAAVRLLEVEQIVRVVRRPGMVNEYQVRYFPQPGEALPGVTLPQPTNSKAGDTTNSKARHTTSSPPQTPPSREVEKEPPHTPPAGDVAEAERWARRWCEIRRLTPTRGLLRRMIPEVQQFLAAGGVPSEEFLQAAHKAGMFTPQGWAWVPGPPEKMEKAHQHRFIDMGGDIGDWCPGCKRYRSDVEKEEAHA